MSLTDLERQTIVQYQYEKAVRFMEEDILPRIEPAQNLLDKIGQYLQEKGFIPAETTETKE